MLPPTPPPTFEFLVPSIKIQKCLIKHIMCIPLENNADFRFYRSNNPTEQIKVNTNHFSHLRQLTDYLPIDYGICYSPALAEDRRDYHSPSHTLHLVLTNVSQDCLGGKWREVIHTERYNSDNALREHRKSYIDNFGIRIVLQKEYITNDLVKVTVAPQFKRIDDYVEVYILAGHEKYTFDDQQPIELTLSKSRGEDFMIVLENENQTAIERICADIPAS